MIQPEILFTNILQHFFFLIQCFLSTCTYQHDRGHGRNDIQIAEHIFLKMFTVKLTIMECVRHQFIDTDLLVNSLNHYLFIDRLIISSDKITIKIDIQIVHVLHKRKRLKCKQVIHIECMLRQFQSTFVKQFCTINNRMHQQIFTF